MLLPFILGFFFLRDVLLLSIGPSARLFPRLRIYAGVFLASVVVAATITNTLDTERILTFLRSPGIVLPSMAFYAALAAVCLWVRRTDRHHRAWLVAVVPNPLLVLGITIMARLSAPQSWTAAAIAGPILLACLWIGIAAHFLKTRAKALQDVPELDYSLELAGLVNSIALLALPAESFLERVAAILPAD